jgi:hypothetical protein
MELQSLMNNRKEAWADSDVMRRLICNGFFIMPFIQKKNLLHHSSEEMKMGQIF